MEKEVFNDLKFRLIDGNFPKNDNEIVISKHIISNGGVELKIGDTIELDIGDRFSLDGTDLDGYIKYDIEAGEELKNTTHRKFKIVGIMERPKYQFEDYGDCGYTVVTTNIKTKKSNAYITLKDPKKYEESICEILGIKNYEQTFELESERFEDYDINSELLRWEVAAISDSALGMLMAVASVVLAIIMISSIFCIRNSFAIAVTEKLKMYGMLSSIGATKKQIKKNVIFEAMVLAIIGIPLGIISGLFAIWVLLKVVSSILGNYLFGYVDGFVFKTSGLAILISVILGLVTIYLSALSSAKKASKVDPIQLLRNSGDIKIKQKKLKVPFLIQKIFKTGGSLAYKNLKRSQKKYRTTVISIAVSVFVFICMSAFINQMFDYSMVYYTDYSYNVEINGDFGPNEEIAKSILRLDNIDEAYMSYNMESSFFIEDKSKINKPDLILDVYREYDDDGNIISEEQRCVPQVIGYDTKTFNKYLEKANISLSDMKNKCILIDKVNLWDEETDKVSVERVYKFKKGDKIEGKIDEKDFYFEIGALSDVHPFGYEQSTCMSGMIIVNIDDFDSLIDFESRSLFINSSDASKLEEEIGKLKLNDINIHNIEKIAQEQKAMALVTKIFVYGFISVITLIGVTNIFNTITANIEFRQKEFASLKSIGMTKKEFNRMVNLETLFYGTKALIYGIIMGCLGTLAIYKAFSIKFESGRGLPFSAMGISIVSVYVLVFIIMRYSVSKVNKQNIIETIRNDNI